MQVLENLTVIHSDLLGCLWWCRQGLDYFWLKGLAPQAKGWVKMSQRLQSRLKKRDLWWHPAVPVEEVPLPRLHTPNRPGEGREGWAPGRLAVRPSSQHRPTQWHMWYKSTTRHWSPKFKLITRNKKINQSTWCYWMGFIFQNDYGFSIL